MAQSAIAALLLQDRLIAGAGGQSLVNRFLAAAPNTAAGTRLFKEPPAEAELVLGRFAEVVTNLLLLPSPSDLQILKAPATAAVTSGPHRVDWLPACNRAENRSGRLLGGDLWPRQQDCGTRDANCRSVNHIQ
jgi:hypothetical protein